MKANLSPFVRIAACSPLVRPADCTYNTEQMLFAAANTAQHGAQMVLFPALSITGATCGDLFFQPALQQKALASLSLLAETTGDAVVVCGLPMMMSGNLYLCAAVLHKQRICGIVPAEDVSGYERWFVSGAHAPQSVHIGAQVIPVAPDLAFDWGACRFQIHAGDAPLLLLPSAFPATLHARKQRARQLAVRADDARCALLYACAGTGESTTDHVFDGYTAAFEPGLCVAEGACYADNGGLCVADIDLPRISYQRSMARMPVSDAPVIELPYQPLHAPQQPARPIPAAPYLPPDGETAYLDELLTMQGQALTTRLTHTGIGKIVLGISGGLDSTLALLTTARAFRKTDRSAQDIHAITMPGPGTTDRTLGNAIGLCETLGVTLRTIPIADSVAQHLKDIGHDPAARDVTYENAQARERTQILMDYANRVGGLVLGTGDLSEIALGWCTYNGDHMSMYGINCGVPKTLIPALIRAAGMQTLAEKELALLEDVIDTPISPELLPGDNGAIAQRTEALLGDYALHDFFLYHVMDSGATPEKLLQLATWAFGPRYTEQQIRDTLRTFVRRFFSQQFKRSCMPDGPQLLSFSLSPRGGWVAPSDASAEAWLE